MAKQPQVRQLRLPFALHDKQLLALNSPATEILYGGAAGGGKSYLMRVAAIVWCMMIPGLQVYFFRRKRGDLIKNHVEGPKGFRAILAPLIDEKICEVTADEIRFFIGGKVSKIFLCHCLHEKDRWNYHGAEIHVLFVDELTHFTDVIYRFLRNRVRAVGLDLPPELRGKFPRIICGSNPGQIGHQWVKEAFISPKPALEIWQTSDEEGGMLRQFIPAVLEDNPSMQQDDPTYRARLRGLYDPAMVRAMELGDWDSVAGAFFPSLDPVTIAPIILPPTWTRARSFDWGFSKPFSVGWWAISNGEQPSLGHLPESERPYFPANCVVRYREWYGASKPNVGLHLSPEQIATGIKQRESSEIINYSVADPACFAADRGPSIAEELSKHGVHFAPAGNKRVPGWQQIHLRLQGLDDCPMLYVFDTCRDSIRILPTLPRDESNTEDIDTDAEDHLADEWRYFCMSRPWSNEQVITVEPLGFQKATFNDLFKEMYEERANHDY